MVNRSLTRGRRGKNLFLFANGFKKADCHQIARFRSAQKGACRGRKSGVRPHGWRTATHRNGGRLEPGILCPQHRLAVLIADKLAVLVAHLNRHTACEHVAERNARKLRGAVLQLDCAWLWSIEAARPALPRRLATAALRNRCRASLLCYSLVIFFNSLILPSGTPDRLSTFSSADW